MSRNSAEPSLDAYKARLPLAEIVGRYVRLVRKGREHSGLCPFHDEKTPSFSVVEDKGFYHCFGCGAHGDAIGFIMSIEGLSFPDALAKIGEITGIEPPRRRESGPKIDPGLAEANAAAMRWFEQKLAGREGRVARAYLAGRGVDDQARERFRLGYAPTERAGLKTWLEASGFSEALAVEAGLLIRPEDGGASYDRFRDRLMFPIEDTRGRVVAFGGRALGDQKAKYLNSPETPIFQKGRMLYGLPLANKAAHKAGRVVVVEGYMDVVALHQAGLEETVAPLGTAITEDQLRLLWRITDEPVLCLDGDRAGFGAALRAAKRALPVMWGGQTLRFALLPEGEDPDSFVRKRGLEAMEGLLRTAMPLSRLVWQAEWSAHPVETPEQLNGLRHRLLDYVKLAEDPSLRSFLREQLDGLVRSRAASLRGSPGSRSGGYRQTGTGGTGYAGRGRGGLSKSSPAPWQRSPEFASGALTSARSSEASLLGHFLLEPGLLVELEEELAEIELTDPELEGLREQLLLWIAADGDLDQGALRHHLSTHGFGRLVETMIGNAAPVSGDSGVDKAAIAEMLHRAAVRRAREGLAEAVEERRLSELDVQGRAADALLNGEPATADIEERRKADRR